MFWKTFKNSDTGWDIQVVPVSDKSLSGQRSAAEFQAITMLPVLLEKSVLGKWKKDSRDHPHIRALYRLYVPVAIDGEVYSAIVTIRETKDNTRQFYLHRLRLLPNADKKGTPAARLGADTVNAAPSPDRTGVPNHVPVINLMDSL